MRTETSPRLLYAWAWQKMGLRPSGSLLFCLSQWEIYIQQSLLCLIVVFITPEFWPLGFVWFLGFSRRTPIYHQQRSKQLFDLTLLVDMSFEVPNRVINDYDKKKSHKKSLHKRIWLICLRYEIIHFTHRRFMYKILDMLLGLMSTKKHWCAQPICKFPFNLTG